MKIFQIALLMTGVVLNIYASQHSFSFNGVVSVVVENENDVLGIINPGDSFTGTFSYADTTDTEPWPTSGQYNQIATLDLTIGGTQFNYDGNMFIAVSDGPSSDYFEYWTNETFDDWDMSWFGFEFEDSNQTALSDDSLPTSYDVTAFTDPIFRLIGSKVSSGDSFHIVMEVQDISSTSEPLNSYTYTTNTPDTNTVTITSYIGSDAEVVVPHAINGLTVTSIGDFAFMGNAAVTNVIITNNVTTIGEHAFFDCSELTSILLPTGITNIASSTFSECINLTNLMIPNSVMSIGDHAFERCISLANITISTNVMLIGDGAFRDCSSLTSIFIPHSVFSIGDQAFLNCSGLQSIEVDNENMDYSSLNGVLYDKSRKALIAYPCGKHGPYTVPGSVKRIPYHAFFECDNLTSLVIPYGITTIEYEMCYGCDGLESVTIPNSVTAVEYNAFKACSSLTEVVMPNSITSLEGGIFQYCGSLTNVVLPNSITTIPAWMFAGTKLTSITIPSTVTSIGGRAFAYDTGTLKTIYFMGDPPSLDIAYPFYQINPNAVFYYMESAAGWGSSFGGFPAVLWNPTIQITDSNFEINTNGFGFSLPIGPINYEVTIEACTNLVSGTWEPVATTLLSDQNADFFTDVTATNHPNRYYRITTP